MEYSNRARIQSATKLILSSKRELMQGDRMFMRISIILIVAMSAQAVDKYEQPRPLRMPIQYGRLFGLSSVQTTPHPIEVKRSMDCPSGAELVGKSCVSIEILPPNLVCPAGTVFLDQQCVTFSNAQRVCPESYLLVGVQCMHQEVSPVDYVCHEGELENGKCLITTSIPPICPPGFHRRLMECVAITTPEAVCQPGYELHNKNCVSHTSSPATPVCPPDFTLIEENKCTKSIPVPPHCNSGFTLIDNECIKEVPQIPAPCPLGYIPVGFECARQDVVQPHSICPPNFSLDSNGECVRDVQAPSVCPPGTSRGATGLCERPVPEELLCDVGFELIRDRCVMVSLIAPDLQCPEDYRVIHNKCKKFEFGDPVPRCLEGVLKDGQCLIQTLSDPQMKCATDFVMTKGPKCVREVPYNCSKTITTTECEIPEYVSEIIGQANATIPQPYSRSSDYKIKEEISGFMGSGKSKESKSTRCSNINATIPQTCIKREELPVEYICPDGGQPVGTSCIEISSTPSVPECKKGHLDKSSQRCVEIDVQPAIQHCSIGTLTTDQQCRVVDEKPPMRECPEGSNEAVGSRNGDLKCVVTEEEVTPPVIELRRQPHAECDVGSLVGEECVTVEKTEREQQCPPNAESRQEGHCIVTSPVVTPEPITVFRPPEYICPTESALVGQSCLTRSSTAPEHVCRVGEIENNDLCVQTADLISPPPRVTTVPAEEICPAGYDKQNDHCRMIISQPAEFECRNGAVRYENKCVAYHDHVPVCPIGSELRQNECVTKSISPPRIIEIKTCTKGEPGC